MARVHCMKILTDYSELKDILPSTVGVDLMLISVTRQIAWLFARVEQKDTPIIVIRQN